MAQISLLETQIEHAGRMESIMKEHPFALDFSMLGSGKTYVSLHLAKKLFKRVVIVAPVSVGSKWERLGVEHNIDILSISYAGLYGTKKKGSGVKVSATTHGLLTRCDTHEIVQKKDSSGVVEDVIVETVSFAATPKWKDLVNDKTLLVFDECQHLKNITQQFDAARTLISEIVHATGCESRVFLLSASPIDKQEQVITMFRLLSIMKSDRLSVKSNEGNVYWKGAREIEEFCTKIDKDKTSSIMIDAKFADNSKDLQHYMYRAFQEVFKPRVSSTMPSIVTPHNVDKRDGYFTIVDEGARERLSLQIAKLRDAVKRIKDGNTLSDDMGNVTKALLGIEKEKAEIFIRYAIDLLEKSQNVKVVLCVNYTYTLECLKKSLEDYKPLVVSGKTSKNDRDTLFQKFQEPSATYRLLICNEQVCSTGIDLDDKHGNFPRVVFVSPNYHAQVLYQLAHRFVRLDSKADAKLFMVFASHDSEESLLKALSRKGAVLKDTCPEQAEAGVLFPGDFPEFRENKDKVLREVQVKIPYGLVHDEEMVPTTNIACSTSSTTTKIASSVPSTVPRNHMVPITNIASSTPVKRKLDTTDDDITIHREGAKIKITSKSKRVFQTIIKDGTIEVVFV